LGHSRPGFLRDFSSPAVLKNDNRRAITPFAYRAVTFFGKAFQLVSTREVIFLELYLTLLGSKRYYLATPKKHMVPEPSVPPLERDGAQFFEFGLFPFRSPLLRE